MIAPAPTAADPITERVRATWAAGDFGRIATGYERGAEHFISRLRILPDERVLDVACGTGNLTLPAARTGARVVGLDIVVDLLDRLRERAAREGLSVALDVGNCEELPYEDGSFETVVTMFGAMFAARPDKVAEELVRVCWPGGRIAMANWTPEGFIGQMFKTTAKFVPPPPDVPSPLLWGSEATVVERLGAATQLHFARRAMTFEYPLDPPGVVDYFRTWYGPTKRAFATLDPATAEQLHAELVELWSEANLARPGATRVESEYLEVVAVKR